MVNFIFIAISFMGMFVSISAATCPIVNRMGCICQFDEQINAWDINCSNKDLTQIPEWSTPRYYEKIKHYRLTHNKIFQAREDHFNGTNVEILELTSNKLNQTDFLSTITPSLKRLYLDSNSDLGSHLESQSPSFIYSLNRIEILKFNRIGATNFDYFSNATNLASLKEFYGRLNNLAENSLRISTFSKMTGLTMLGLDDNRIPDLEWLKTSALSSLQTLDVRSNRIREFLPQHIEHLDNLVSIDLRDNEITQLRRTTFSTLSNLNSIETVYLSANPINCTCQLLWLTDWLNSHSGINVVLDDIDCIMQLPTQCDISSVSVSSTPNNSVSTEPTNVNVTSSIPKMTPETTLGSSTTFMNRGASPPPPTSVQPSPTTSVQQPSGLNQTTIITIAVVAAVVVLGIIIAVAVVMVIRNRHHGSATTNPKMPPPPKGSRATIDSKYKYNTGSWYYTEPDHYYSSIKQGYQTGTNDVEGNTPNRLSQEERANMPLPPTPDDIQTVNNNSYNSVPSESGGYFVPISNETYGYIKPTDGNATDENLTADGYLKPTDKNLTTDGYLKPTDENLSRDSYLKPTDGNLSRDSYLKPTDGNPSTDCTYQELSFHGETSKNYIKLGQD